MTLDYNMPIHTGAELVDLLISRDLLYEAKVLFVTGEDISELMAGKYRLLGASVIAKPFKADVFKDMLINFTHEVGKEKR